MLLPLTRLFVLKFQFHINIWSVEIRLGTYTDEVDVGVTVGVLSIEPGGSVKFNLFLDIVTLLLGVTFL